MPHSKAVHRNLHLNGSWHAEPARLRRGPRLALARPPKPSETSQMLDFLKREPLEQMCRVLFNLNEFVYAD